jgi:glycosyltransferase involved in cell wall biosynthesis
MKNLNSIETSVIMPVFNTESYLREAIESVLNQTYKDFEFIIINDGSTDDSLSVIKSFDDNRIKLISQKNKGIIASLNKGLEIAKGKFIVRMDSDDISLPERFEKQVKLMKSQNIDICGGNYMTINNSGILLKLYSTPRTHELCTLSLMSKVPFAHPSVIMRKDFLKKHNLRYGQSIEKKAEDLDLWIRIHEKGGRFFNIDETILKYRILSKSLSIINNYEILKETKTLTNNFFLRNHYVIKKIIFSQKEKLNDEEQAIIIRALFKIYFKKFKFNKVYLLRKFDKKIIIKTLLSEIKVLWLNHFILR